MSKKWSKGKQFENNFEKSLSDEWFFMRVKDSANSIDHSQVVKTVSHQTKGNLCDFIVFIEPWLFLCELKETKGKSLSFQNFPQYERLKGVRKKKVFPCVIIRFSDLNETYIVRIFPEMEFDRKSIPIKYCREHGIKVDSKLLRVNYRYNLEKAFKDCYKLLTVL